MANVELLEKTGFEKYVLVKGFAHDYHPRTWKLKQALAEASKEKSCQHQLGRSVEIGVL